MVYSVYMDVCVYMIYRVYGIRYALHGMWPLQKIRGPMIKTEKRSALIVRIPTNSHVVPEA